MTSTAASSLPSLSRKISKMVVCSSVIVLLLTMHTIQHLVPVNGFSVVPLAAKSSSATLFTTPRRTTNVLFQTATTEVTEPITELSEESDNAKTETTSSVVRAPMKFVGPYTVLGLEFPELATSSQLSRNISGISLDFVLDTASNVNTINGQVAKELKLPVVGQAPPGVSASGGMLGGKTYLLGSCQLEGLLKEDQFIFMENLTASALPVASPAAAGLLSMPFFYCFEGGVEFQWKPTIVDPTTGQQLPPSITFYGDYEESNAIRKNMTAVTIEELPVTRLPCVQLNINGVTIPALFDTGSPITVLNSQAAEKAGITTVIKGGDQNNNNKSFNPLAGLANKFQEAQAAAQAAARGDILTIAGSGGERVDLLRSSDAVAVTLPSSSPDEADVDFGNRNVYVGNIPGLAALNGLGDDSPPAAVLGMDVLRSRKMLLLARNNQVFF